MENDSSKIETVNINPSREGFQHAISLFNQQAKQSEQDINLAETLITYLEDTELTIKELPPILWQAEELLVRGLQLVIQEEAKRVESMELGIAEAQEALGLPQSDSAQAASTRVKVGDQVQVRRKRRDSGLPVKPNWAHDLWGRVEKVGRSTLTLRFNNIEQTVTLNQACVDFKSYK